MPFPLCLLHPQQDFFSATGDKTLGCRQPLSAGGGDEKINDKLEQFLAQSYPDDIRLRRTIEWQLNAMSNLRSA